MNWPPTLLPHALRRGGLGLWLALLGLAALAADGDAMPAPSRCEVARWLPTDSPQALWTTWQRGLASWYGRGFHNRRTASGERFDANGFTAAHRSLPFGTKLTVRNPDNNRTVVVRVTDRGPHVGNRSLDLSRAAARALGILHRGTAPIEWLVGAPTEALSACADAAR